MAQEGYPRDARRQRHGLDGLRGATRPLSADDGTVALNVKEPAEAERVFNALAKDGTIRLPLGETFFAIKFGMLTDRYGTPWMINCEKVS